MTALSIRPTHQPEALDRGGEPSVEAVLDQLRTMEQELGALRNGLAHSHRLATVGTLAATLVHEYNNLLTPIVSYAQMALAEPEDTDLTRKALEKSMNSALQAAKISEALLAFVREDQPAAIAESSGGAREGGRPAADLANTVQASLDCLARDLARDGIELTVDVNSVCAAMDPTALQHVLINLLVNARKALLGAGVRRGGRITLRARRIGDRVHLTVADTGPGIPDHLMHHLFEPFVTHPTSSDPADHAGCGQGTGLGLALCRHFVEQAGGSIRASNQTGSGTGATFHIDLPAAA